MTRVLVPLDGTDLAMSIYPDAVRLAGPEGELILVRGTTGPTYDPDPQKRSGSYAFEQVKTYLDIQAQTLRAKGINVQTDTLVLGDAAAEIDDAAVILGADMIACATHGCGPWGEAGSRRSGLAGSGAQQGAGAPVSRRIASRTIRSRNRGGSWCRWMAHSSPNKRFPSHSSWQGNGMLLSIWLALPSIPSIPGWRCTRRI